MSATTFTFVDDWDSRFGLRSPIVIAATGDDWRQARNRANVAARRHFDSDYEDEAYGVVSFVGDLTGELSSAERTIIYADDA
ncbi:hypothetical protein GCM10010411_76410 [Actinomadura fulvescens]|uniref:Uncharacterized protein n=1 Tax=Actinomadura fulvescens TaxID=46160 RepID=A0ABN3QJ62_9ACTN